MTLKSRPITYEITDKITGTIVNNSMAEKEEQLKQDSFAFANKVYDRVYKSELKRMNDLPEGYLLDDTSLRFQFSDASDGYTLIFFKEKKRILAKHRSDVVAKFENDDELTKEFFQLKNRKEDLVKEKKDLTIKTRAVINSYNTTKQLKDAWPEIKKYVEPYETVPEKSRSLAPIIGDLNKKLQLGEK